MTFSLFFSFFSRDGDKNKFKKRHVFLHKYQGNILGYSLSGSSLHLTYFRGAFFSFSPARIHFTVVG